MTCPDSMEPPKEQGGTVVANPLRMPHEITLALADNTVVAESPLIERIVCDALDNRVKEPTYNFKPGEPEQHEAPVEFSLDDHGRLFTRKRPDAPWLQWQLRMAVVDAWPSSQHPVRVTAYFRPISTRVALLTLGDLTRIGATPPSPAA